MPNYLISIFILFFHFFSFLFHVPLLSKKRSLIQRLFLHTLCRSFSAEGNFIIPRHHEKAEGFCGDPVAVITEMPVLLDGHIDFADSP